MLAVTLTVIAEPVRFVDTTILLTTILFAITTPPTILGPVVPIMSIAPTAANILAPVQVMVLPIQAGLAVIGMNTAETVIS